MTAIEFPRDGRLPEKTCTERMPHRHLACTVDLGQKVAFGIDPQAVHDASSRKTTGVVAISR